VSVLQVRVYLEDKLGLDSVVKGSIVQTETRPGGVLNASRRGLITTSGPHQTITIFLCTFVLIRLLSPTSTSAADEKEEEEGYITAVVPIKNK